MSDGTCARSSSICEPKPGAAQLERWIPPGEVHTGMSKCRTSSRTPRDSYSRIAGSSP
jgi:hypothetical protein